MVSPMCGSCVDALADDFRRGVPVGCVVEPVLHVLVELTRDVAVLVVVGADLLEYGEHLLVEAFLAGADLPHPGEELFEVVLSERVAVLEHVVVECEALDHVFVQHAGRPLAKGRGLRAVDPVSDGYDCVQIVEADGAANRSAAFVSNLYKKCTGCVFVQFAFTVNVLYVTCHGLWRHSEELRDVLLRHPERSLPVRDLDRHVHSIGTVEDHLSSVIGIEFLARVFHRHFVVLSTILTYPP